jgi:hypothetical protein
MFSRIRARRVASIVLLFLAICFGTAWSQAAKEKTDAEIKQEIIHASIASYSGSCPCPYSTDRAGRRCGRRSAYSRPGGASPLCYPEDVTQKMVHEWRKRNKAKETDRK